MAKYNYQVRLSIYDDRAKEIEEIVKSKKKSDHRKTDSDTVEAIILEYPELLERIDSSLRVK